MANGGAAMAGAEVFSNVVDRKLERVLMLMLYPLVMLMSAAARSVSIFWPFSPVHSSSDAPVVEQPLVALLRTCVTFVAVVLLHMYMACHHLGVRGPVRVKRQFAWFAPMALWFGSTTFFISYVTFPCMIGDHPAEMFVAAAGSSILFIFTIVLLGVQVPLKK